MCRVARRNGENKRTKIVEGRRKGIFFTFYLKIVGVYDNGNFYKENYVTAKIGGSDLLPHSHERWHGNMDTGTDF